ncbi:hypothetical protein HOR18_gp026 [Staphylococcus phage vB_SscM-1]|uniref:Uncharacterized protein n=2 Tax=Sciuriunavirus SscM1 TaxID=2734053 RepID=A0A1X9I9Q3_9CAUD|nr:hypothetical protein HOR18_gp026 [Staphylococcus phage vB_SscM-1]ANT44689.1 hypothetical protein vB_SscM-1_026 [Staphylococcus phage vB_SscM-1]ANT44892.1 hypothetical protein vB_SscM-2_025 [Staphylococcus phage vB_SscM-2]
MHYHLIKIITKNNDLYIYYSVFNNDKVLREIFSKDKINVISSNGEYVEIPTSSIADIKYEELEFKYILKF